MFVTDVTTKSKNLDITLLCCFIWGHLSSKTCHSVRAEYVLFKDYNVKMSRICLCFSLLLIGALQGKI